MSFAYFSAYLDIEKKNERFKTKFLKLRLLFMPQAPEPHAGPYVEGCEKPLLAQIFRNLSFSPETKLLSHLCVHVVNQLFRENRKTIPKILSGKNL